MSLFREIQRWTVTTLTRYLREVLDSDENIKNIWVSGEVSNLSKPSSGHVYFTLKDATASLKCVMWKSDVVKIKLNLRDGLAVDVFGSISIYETGGQYQLYTEVIKEVGEGALFQEYLRLKELFEKEGLFDIDRKKQVPILPRKIGLVTSITGAAIKDVLSVIERRLPMAEVIISPCQVQGDGAAGDIAWALEKINRQGISEVIILARGGGSFEDLWAFNSETVVHAIAKSELPVITGIGHETDFTLADFVADLRAPTPSVAAELATPITVMDMKNDLVNMNNLIINQMEELIKSKKDKINALSERTAGLSPMNRLRSIRQSIDEMDNRINIGIYKKLDLSHSLIDGRSKQLSALSPSAVIKRGYAVVMKKGKTVFTKSQVRSGDNLNIRVSDGEFDARVTNDR
jgi:exodeoxyribonuclease VII large subunit